MKIGVLAIQGDFALHIKMLNNMQIDCIEVKTVDQLNQCNGLIIPGGESTTLVKLLKQNNLFNAIKQFAIAGNPIMGTCAGLILLAKFDPDSRIENMNLIDIDVLRNAYGRQINSFVERIDLSLNGTIDSFEGVFIRAPKITRVGEQVKILARYNSNVIMVEDKNILGLTFHPELTNDSRIHHYFIQKITEVI